MPPIEFQEYSETFHSIHSWLFNVKLQYDLNEDIDVAQLIR